MDPTSPIPPSRSEQNLISDLKGSDKSTQGSPNVYALTNNQKESTDRQSKDADSSWDVLHEALWRTPFTDYADEWVSVAMFNTKQFLFSVFDKAVKSSTNGRKRKIILLHDGNWQSYDKHTARVRGEIRLV